MIKWHCIRCGKRLKIVAKTDPTHGDYCWAEMQRSGTTMFQCSNKKCYHEGAPLTLHHPSNTRTAANPPNLYSISFLK
jgi:hypothetical protein